MGKCKKIIFVGKQHIPWNEVEEYLKKYVGETIVVEQYQDNIYIAYDFPEEYSESKDTKKLRGGLAKAKANAAQVIDQLIKNATKRRWRENLDPKHDKDASGGWYRYDAFFTIPVRGQDEDKERRNYYRGTVLVRINPKGLYLYDVVDIKKKRVRRLSQNDRTVKNRFSISMIYFRYMFVKKKRKRYL